jgi:hypothetical protein
VWATESVSSGPVLRSEHDVTLTMLGGPPLSDDNILDVSSADPVIIGALAALDATRKTLGEAHQRLADSNAVPDVADIAETTTLAAAAAVTDPDPLTIVFVRRPAQLDHLNGPPVAGAVAVGGHEVILPQVRPGAGRIPS